jgi:hypothetical protein
VRYRHSESTSDRVESQLKKAIAARKPKFHKVAGSGSRSEALACASADRQGLDADAVRLQLARASRWRDAWCY